MPHTSASQTGLRRVDAGWLYLLAGAALVSCMVLIGPADDLLQLRHRSDRLAGLESDAVAKLQGYETFLEALDEADPMLVRRLAAAQLNLIPENVKPIGLIGAQLDARVDDWIHETLPPVTIVDPPLVKDSWLRRLSAGPTRMWTMLAGVVLIFIGLLPQSDPAGLAVAEDVAEDDDALPVEDALSFAMGDAGFEDDIDAEHEAESEVAREDEGDASPQPVPHRRLIVTEAGELIEDEDGDVEGDSDPRVQVVTISASSSQ